MYDPAVGRWHVLDPMSELYWSQSPYSYVLNNPINAIDPDGNVIIFINGNHFGDGGSPDYWRNSTGQFDTEVMNYLGDTRAIYRDGGVGGFMGFMSDNPIGVNTAPVGDANEGTLGWYYSENNGTSTENERYNEPLTPITDYPYSRTLYHRDGSGMVKGVAGPGEAHYAGSGHVATQDLLPVEDDDEELKLYLSLRNKELGLTRTTAFTGNFFRSVYVDENDRKSITYQDKAGNTIIALYYGEEASPITRSYQIYDAAGRLKVSISPNGVAEYDGTNYNTIAKTRYEYNYKGRLVTIEEPDAGLTKYIYRKDGSIRFSENALQRKEESYSYTNYDQAGRPVASGEYVPGVTGIAFGSDEMMAILENEGPDGGLSRDAGIRRYETITAYDSPGEVPGGRVQRFTRGNVSYSQNENVTSWYSYDDLGRVEWMVQDIAGLGTKTVDYRYGPDGNVREVAYQKGDPTEDFYHYYTYDADGRLKEAYTSLETLEYNLQGELVNQDALKLQAAYKYYLHGPLKRVVLADGLQGIDYTYTINGALKTINHAAPDPAKDPGHDGDGNVRRRDVFGMMLNYYPDDYQSADFSPGAVAVANDENLYNGNIKTQSWHSAIDSHEPRAYTYNYDQRYQLVQADWGDLEASGENYSFDKAEKGAYQELIGGYDGNGNIQSLQRVGGIGIEIADFEYEYKAHKNQLERVLHGGGPFLEYEYNAIGQMVKQTEGNKDIHVSYDVTGKVTEVTAIYPEELKTQKLASFSYDERGFRLSKTSYDKEGNEAHTTWYVRDASGNVLSMYVAAASAAGQAKQAELPIYGSGRLGLYRPNVYLSNYMYELSDHLGNVRVVIGEGITVEYLATMESDTEVQENEGYFERTTSIPTANYINHTPSTVTVDGKDYFIDNPNEVARVNNAKDVPQKVVGSAIVLPVYPGDVINAEVFVKYADFEKNSTNILAGLVGFLCTSFGFPPPVDGAATIFDDFVDELAALSAMGKINEDVPRAFLNYIVFDKNFIMKDYGIVQVSEVAEIPEKNHLNHPHERLSFDKPIEIKEEGSIYIFVSGQDMDVYFDDFRVTHEYGDIVAGSDYYPLGLAMSARQVTRDPYRYGYQGQFSEMDEETGWNSFQLRQYDARIGRFTTIDPAGQFSSPYLGMGNNPVNGVDPDGGTWYDDIYYNSKKGQTTIVETNFADRLWIDGEYFGYTGGLDGGWRDWGLNNVNYFSSYSLFFNNQFGDKLLNDRFFSQQIEALANRQLKSGLFEARVRQGMSTHGTKILIGTLAVPTAIIGGTELAIAAPSLYWDAGKVYNAANLMLNEGVYKVALSTAPYLGKTKFGRQLLMDAAALTEIHGLDATKTTLYLYNSYKRLRKFFERD